MGRNKEDDFSESMRRLVEGDLRELSILSSASDAEIKAWTGALAHPPTVSRAAVSRVLRLMLAGEVSPEAIQAWASLMRWGVVRRPSGPIDVDIDYESSYEDEIIDVIARLDEIGDLIDGEITADEGEDMIRKLSK